MQRKYERGSYFRTSRLKTGLDLVYSSENEDSERET